LSPQDRSIFKNALGVITDEQAVAYLINNFDTEDLTQGILGVLQALEARKDKVENIVGSLEDRMPYVYKEAKNFVLEVIRDNQALKTSATTLMQTRHSLYVELLNKLNATTTATIVAEIEKLDAEKNTLLAKQDFNDRYYDLLYNLIPNLENKAMAIESLKTNSSRTGENFATMIFRELYPNDPLAKLEEDEIAMEVAELEQATGDVDEDIKEAVNISEYIKEYNKSVELTLSESMKDFLLTASVASSKGGQKYITPGLMYVKLLQITAQFEFGSSPKYNALDNVLVQVREMRRRDLSEVDDSILKILEDTLMRAVNEDVPELHKVSKNVSIVTGTDTGGNIWYAGAVGNNISNYTYEELKRMPGVKVTNQEQSSNLLYKALKAEYPELTILDFNTLLARAEAINVARGLVNTMASMRETDLYIGVKSYQGGYTTKFTRSKASGISFSIKETIRNAFAERFNEGTFFKTINQFNNAEINKRKVKSIPESGSAADKLEYIKKFYKDVAGIQGINIGASLASDASGKLQDYVTQISQLLEVAANLSTQDPGKAVELLASDDQFVAEAEDLKNDTFTSFISNIDGYLTRLSEFASMSSEYLRNPSVRTLKGDRYYKWHESSFAFDVLGYFVEGKNSDIRGATGNNQAKMAPKFLKSTFYDFNPFVRGTTRNKIFTTGEWEGSLNEDNQANVPYLRENYNFFYQKKYVQSFLDGMKQFKNQYFQYVYVPSEKPKHPLVRVEILTNAETTAGIEAALRQILHTKN